MLKRHELNLKMRQYITFKPESNLLMILKQTTFLQFINTENMVAKNRNGGRVVVKLQKCEISELNTLDLNQQVIH